jgi:hypothetical protein
VFPHSISDGSDISRIGDANTIMCGHLAYSESVVRALILHHVFDN